MAVKLAIHHQNIITFVLCCFYEAELGVLVSSIEINDIAILVGLIALDALAIILEREEFAFSVFEQGKVHSPLAELLVGKHAVFDEQLDVVPFLLVLFAFSLENIFQPVSNLLRDVCADFLYVGVALQITAADVQRNVRRVDHTVKQSQKIWHYVVHVLGHEHLVAVELYLVLVDGHALLDLREVQHAGKVERIIDVEVYPEHWILLHRIEGLVEIEVILVLELGRSLGPDRIYVVDDVVLFGFYLLAVLPLGFLAEYDRHRHKLAVLLQQGRDSALVGEFFRILVQEQGDGRAPFGLLALAHLERRGAVAAPFHRRCSLFPAQGIDGNLACHHKCRVESETEMAYDILVLVFLEEFACGGECYLVDIPVNLLGGHSYAVVGDCQYFIVLVEGDFDLQVPVFAGEFSRAGESLELLAGIDRIGDELAQEDFVVRIKKLLDYREYVLRSYTDFTVYIFHIF